MKKSIATGTVKAKSEEVIPLYINEDVTNKEALDNKSQEVEPESKIVDMIETKENLLIESKLTLNKPFSAKSLFKRKMKNTVKRIIKSPRTIRVMIKSDYTLYPIDIPIKGKTIEFKGRRYKIDGYEHRLYELQGVQCLFVDINDARPLELSHKSTNIAYDAREFCSIFDSKAITELTAQSVQDAQLDKITGLVVISILGTAAVLAVLFGVMKPEWQQTLISVSELAKQAAVQAIQNTAIPEITQKTISGV